MWERSRSSRACRGYAIAQDIWRSERIEFDDMLRERAQSPQPSNRRSGPQDVAGDGPFDRRLGVPLDVAASSKCGIDGVEIKRGQALSDALHFHGCQRDVVGIGPQ